MRWGVARARFCAGNAVAQRGRARNDRGDGFAKCLMQQKRMLNRSVSMMQPAAAGRKGLMARRGGRGGGVVGPGGLRVCIWLAEAADGERGCGDGGRHHAADPM